MSIKENRTLIITGGRIEDEFIKKILESNHYSMIIAVDRGLEVADRFGLPIDYIVGDFDSTSSFLLDKYREKQIPMKSFPVEKDKSDTHLAVELALNIGTDAIDLIGATGTRLDHTLANLHLLLIPLQNKTDAFILDSHNKIYLKQDSFTIDKNRQYGDYISFLPFHGDVHDLRLEGFKYPLPGILLTAGDSLCISNEIMDEQAIVSFTDGILAVFETRD
ncbi:MAG: thiamine diphosphokinase [Clostridiales bacterium]|nr:thiamine diphosphokinase [Clostridiales bacterium]